MAALSNISKRNKILGGGLLILFLVSCLYLYSYTHQKPSTPTTIIPTPSPLSVTNSYPGEGTTTLTFPATALTYTFNQAIALSQVRVDISPKIQTVVALSSDNKTLSVKPVSKWQFNTHYQITLVGPQGIELEKKTVTFTSPSGSVPSEDTEPNPKGI